MKHIILSILFSLLFITNSYGALTIDNTIQTFPSDLIFTGTSVALVDHLINKSSLKANSSIQLIIQVISIIAKYFINRKK